VKVFLSDGRALRYWNGGGDGQVVLVFHGCPDTRRIAMTGAKAAYDAGVRLLAFNRPGYGSSTPFASTHSTVARDAAELLDLWRIDRVAALGMSVGGSYAAAFAAAYPDRVGGLALVSAQANAVTDTEGTVEDAVERLRPEFMVWRAKVDPDDEDDAALAARFLAELPEADAALLREFDDEFVAYLAFESLVKTEGYLRDAALLFREWDFDPSAVRCPTTLWCGELDEAAMDGSAWWAERVPQAEVEVLPGITHLGALLTRWPEILRRLVTSRGDSGTATG
jgi:pimeloyl-ACP methyl ester carboxylesterase